MVAGAASVSIGAPVDLVKVGLSHTDFFAAKHNTPALALD